MSLLKISKSVVELKNLRLISVFLFGIFVGRQVVVRAKKPEDKAKPAAQKRPRDNAAPPAKVRTIQSLWISNCFQFTIFVDPRDEAFFPYV